MSRANRGIKSLGTPVCTRTGPTNFHWKSGTDPAQRSIADRTAGPTLSAHSRLHASSSETPKCLMNGTTNPPESSCSKHTSTAARASASLAPKLIPRPLWRRRLLRRPESSTPSGSATSHRYSTRPCCARRASATASMGSLASGWCFWDAVTRLGLFGDHHRYELTVTATVHTSPLPVFGAESIPRSQTS